MVILPSLTGYEEPNTSMFIIYIFQYKWLLHYVIFLSRVWRACTCSLVVWDEKWDLLACICTALYYFPSHEYEILTLMYVYRRHSGAVVSTVTSQPQGVSVWSLCVHPEPAWVPSRYSVSSQSSKTCKLGFRLIGHFKLPVGVNVSVDGCLSLYVTPAMMNWRLVQGDPAFA